MKFQLGDWVRISKVKRIFEKGYTANWSQEIFQIVSTTILEPPMYYLEDYNGEKIKGCFYIEELQKTELHDIFLINEILKQKKIHGRKQYLVSWVGYGEKFNSWVDESDLLTA